MKKNGLVAFFGTYTLKAMSKAFVLSLMVLLVISLTPKAADAACTATAGVGISFGGGWGGSIGGCKEDPIGATFRQAAGLMTGATGKALCSLAIIIAGIGALFGRITWIRCLVIALGIALIFGTSSILFSVTNTTQGAPTIAGTGQCDDPTTILTNGAPLAIGPFAGLPLNAICDQLRTIVNTISGSTGQGIAIIAILILGLSALFGKLSPAQALLTATGLALVFAAVNLVNLFWDNNNSNSDCVFNQLLDIGTPNLVFCRFLQEIRGDSARFLSTIAVMVLGFLAMLGRLQWQYALVCICGIATVYGSDAIINIIAPSMVSSCQNLTTPSIGASLGAIEGVLCNVVRMISGEAGRALASAAVVVLGFSAMMGKINFASALILCCGIAIAFGAPHMVFILTGMIDKCSWSASVSLGMDICSFTR